MINEKLFIGKKKKNSSRKAKANWHIILVA